MTASSDRGQAHTLEGIAAAILVLASVIFALQVTAVTPLTASTASQHIENQHQGAAAGLLSTADANGDLRSTLLYWNTTNSTFHNSGNDSFYTTGGPPTAFGESLNVTFEENGIAFNVNLLYLTSDGDQRERQLVNLGRPSDHAIVVRSSVPIYDDDEILAADGSSTGTTVENASSFYADDIDPESNLYNVVKVEVVIWRM